MERSPLLRRCGTPGAEAGSARQAPALRSGARKGEIKTTKIRYFRPPNERDLEALANAERKLNENWERWDAEGLIPTERFPDGNDMRPVSYGMTRWCDLFTPRQLLGHVTLIERLNHSSQRSSPSWAKNAAERS